MELTIDNLDRVLIVFWEYSHKSGLRGLGVLPETKNDVSFLTINIFQESRISDNFPFCINGTQIEKTIAENGCRGDFLLSSLDPHQGILEASLSSLGENMTVCREGSLPDIVHKIARQIVTVVGDCE